MSKRHPELSISPFGAAIALGAIGALLVVLHLAGLFSKFYLEHGRVYGLVHLFDLGAERNVPTLFSTCLFVLNAALFGVVWYVRTAGSQSRFVWLLLTFIFCFLALDEFASIHESLILPVRKLLNTSGLLYFAWVIPYGLGVAVLAIIVIPTLSMLDKRVRRWLFASAITYVSGAIGVESVEGWYYEKMGTRDLTYGLMVMVEESLEMAGLILLVYSLVFLLQVGHGGFQIKVGCK